MSIHSLGDRIEDDLRVSQGDPMRKFVPIDQVPDPEAETKIFAFDDVGWMGVSENEEEFPQKQEQDPCFVHVECVVPGCMHVCATHRSNEEDKEPVYHLRKVNRCRCSTKRN